LKTFIKRYHRLSGQQFTATNVIDLKLNSGQIRTLMTSVNAVMRIVMLLTVGALAACGGGGGDSFAAPPPPAGGSGWQQGVFLAASTFAGRCNVPRAGTGDMQGTTTDENNFLRSYSDDTYLWYNEIVDQDPGLFNDPLVYFDDLQTTAITPSGAPKDKFHFTFDTDEWIQLSQSGVSAGYGAQFAIISSSPPRKILVAYTEPNSPATNLALPLARGAEFISVNGVSVANGDANALNTAFFPSAAGQTNEFEVLDVGAPSTRMVTMTSKIVTSAPVQNTKVIGTPTGNIGYMLFNDHIATAEQALIDAVNQLKTDAGPQGLGDLVLDLRYNGGGFLAIASELAFMIAGTMPTAGQTFELTQFNDKHPATNPVTGQAISPLPFFDATLGPPFNGNGGIAGLALPTLDLQRVYVLTGPGTCSASEAIMNSLRGVNVEVIQIGSTTCGKPYGFFATDNCGTTYFTIQFRGVNALNFGAYTDGFSPANTQNSIGTVIPGCSVADDFTKALGDPTEGRLSIALAHQSGQACPAPTGIGSPPVLGKVGAPLWATDGIVPKSPWHTNRIMRPQQ
jgi:C-terminal processing protease CtpA/Prc